MNKDKVLNINKLICKAHAFVNNSIKKTLINPLKKNCIMIIYVYFNEHNKELPFYTIHFKCI